MSTAVLIPTFGRPHTIPTLVANVAATAQAEHTLYFIAEHDDAATIAAVEATSARLLLNSGPRTYAACIDLALAKVHEPFLFAGADDLHFGLGWLRTARTDMADPAVGVVGSCDPMHRLGDHATHYLLRRAYIVEHGGAPDNPGQVFHPYAHGWTDWELVSTAKVRAAYRFSERCIVHHLHPGWEVNGQIKTSSALFDETYAKANDSNRADWDVFVGRSALWREALQRRAGNTAADEHILRLLRRELEPPRTAWEAFLNRRRLLRSVRKRWGSARRMLGGRVSGADRTARERAGSRID